MSAVGDFAIELEVETIAARARALVSEHLAARWRAQRDGRSLPRSPAELADEQLWRRLAGWRRQLAPGSLLARRVDRLWRLFCEAIVACDGEIGMAADDDDGRSLIAQVEARNRVARRLGWPDYYALALELSDLDAATVSRCVEASEKASREPRQRVVTGSVAPLGALPTPSPALLCEHIGAALDERVRVDVIPGSAARTYVVDPRAGDIRLLVGETTTIAAWRDLAHELGHAWYASKLDPGLPWLLALAAAPCVDEAIAGYFAAVVDSVSFMVEGLGMSERRAREVSAIRHRARWGWRRWQQVRTLFERDLYSDPRSDLDQRWRELLDLHVGGARDYPPWHSVAHLRTDPGSQANYLVGDEICRRCLEPRGWGRSIILAMSEMLRPGASRPWRSLLRSYAQCEV